MRLSVWVDSWQHECCGEPFAVGSEVRWTLIEHEVDRLNTLFPPASGVTVDRTEDRLATGS